MGAWGDMAWGVHLFYFFTEAERHLVCYGSLLVRLTSVEIHVCVYIYIYLAHS